MSLKVCKCLKILGQESQSGAPALSVICEEVSGMKGDFFGSRESSAAIVSGLGGRENILAVSCCATRLRCQVIRPDTVNDEALKKTGALGIIRRGEDVQIVYGVKAAQIKTAVWSYLKAPDEADDKQNKIKAEIFKQKKRRILCSPFKGMTAPIAECCDEAFAGKLMGDGYIVIPTEGVVIAPENCTVSFIAPEGYAVGFYAEDGIECMIHVGVDTVFLEGCGFRTLVEEGQRVKKGDRLMEFDLDYIRSHAVSEQCMAVFPNLTEGEEVVLYVSGKVKPLEKVAEIVSC